MSNAQGPRHFSLIYKIAYNIARIPVALVTKRHWSGQENLPKEGGFIAAANHVSEFDSMTFMHFVVSRKIPVRVLVKSGLFKVPVLNYIMKSAGQIPVYRSSDKAHDALDNAVKALRAGECIGIFPEGTLTRDPDYWPMKPKTGAARMALQARVPVVPIAQWGAHDIIDRYRRKPHLFPPKDIYVRAFEPIDFSDLWDRADDPEAWKEASMRIMEPIRQQIGIWRGEEVPEPIWDTKIHGDLGKQGLHDLAVKWEEKHPKLPPSKRPTRHRPID